MAFIGSKVLDAGLGANEAQQLIIGTAVGARDFHLGAAGGTSRDDEFDHVRCIASACAVDQAMCWASVG
ncbi:hypothetical protein [Cupriavidus sp. CP313]